MKALTLQGGKIYLVQDIPEKAMLRKMDEAISTNLSTQAHSGILPTCC